MYALQLIEEHAVQLPNFNPGGLPTRKSENESEHASRFWMRAPMFLRVGHRERKPAAPSHLHDWVIRADKRSRMYRANPHRPAVYVYDDDSSIFTPVESSDALAFGDIVVVTFTVSILFTTSHWNTQFIPHEVIRINQRTAEGDASEYAPPVVHRSLLSNKDMNSSMSLTAYIITSRNIVAHFRRVRTTNFELSRCYL